MRRENNRLKRWIFLGLHEFQTFKVQKTFTRHKRGGTDLRTQISNDKRELARTSDTLFVKRLKYMRPD